MRPDGANTRGKDVTTPLTLLEMNERVGRLVCTPGTTEIWITAEISDFSHRNHAYLELVQKDDAGTTLAKARATVWANTFYRLDSEFFAKTGSRLAAGQKVMLLVSATLHPAFGYSLNVTGIYPEFTVGDIVLRRKENIKRLTREGIIDMNRTLQWSPAPMRLAVISSESAAGYGDFCRQLHDNAQSLKFTATLFPALMQGNSAAQSIIRALDEIGSVCDSFDGVVIIRGGGAADDLSCFEDYDLAANVAQFPLPVIIGIGHERDITLLDFVANMRVKTPTAAAAWLVARAADALAAVMSLGDAILRRTKEIVAENTVFLSEADLILRNNISRIMETEKSRLRLCASNLRTYSVAETAREKSRLDSASVSLRTAAENLLSKASARIDAAENLLKALSPESTLRRGYTITLHNGKACFDPSELKEGEELTTRFYCHTIKSTVNGKKE